MKEKLHFINKAVSVLKNGGIIIYPTDTVFGIGCLADNHKAIQRLFEMRKRPKNQAVTLLVNSVSMASKYFKDLNPQVIKLMDKYWPGALSIVYYCNKEKVNSLIRADGDTVGIRMPKYKTTLEIINRAGVPLLGPSANFHNDKTPYKVKDLDKDLVRLVDFVVPGDSFGSKASTVVDCTKTPFKVLRPGALKFYTLNIDTTGHNKTSVSISDGIHTFRKQANDKAQVALFLIDNLLKENKLQIKDIAQISLNKDQGSFIGARIGQTIAKTFSYVLNIPVFIILIFFAFGAPQTFAIDIKSLVNESIKSSSVIFSDPSYKNSSNRFQAGNTIYIKIDTNSTGSKNRTIRILDSNKNFVKNVNVTSANNLIEYTGVTTLDQSGTYYLDVKIEDGSNSFSLQQNIEITGNKKAVISIIPTVPEIPKENKFVASPSSVPQLSKIHGNSITQSIISFVNKIVDVILNKVKDL